jgi:hypothetical protein
MRARNLAIIVGVVAAAGVAAFAAARPKPPAVAQPIAFNHHKHTVKDNERSPVLACTECHAGAEKSAIAGLPSVDRCLACHMKEQSDREEERAVRALAGKGGPLAFQQVTRNAGHVYFSHRAHVVLGELQCSQCHGDVTSWSAPPERADPRLTSMDACVDCHRTHGASTGCSTCHK